MSTTPKELAAQLGTQEQRVRKILRSKYRPNGENKNARWVLDDAMTAYVRTQLGR